MYIAILHAFHSMQSQHIYHTLLQGPQDHHFPDRSWTGHACNQRYIIGTLPIINTFCWMPRHS